MVRQNVHRKGWLLKFMCFKLKRINQKFIVLVIFDVVEFANANHDETVICCCRCRRRRALHSAMRICCFTFTVEHFIYVFCRLVKTLQCVCVCLSVLTTNELLDSFDRSLKFNFISRSSPYDLFICKKLENVVQTKNWNRFLLMNKNCRTWKLLIHQLS